MAGDWDSGVMGWASLGSDISEKIRKVRINLVEWEGSLCK